MRRAASLLGPVTGSLPLLQYPKLVLAVLLLGGLAARIVLANGREYPTYDGTYYMSIGRDLAEFGHVPYSTFPPGFPALIALTLLSLGTRAPIAPLRAAQCVNVVAGTMVGLLAYLLARRRLPEWTAMAVAAVTLALPQQLVLSSCDLSELSYACLLLGGWLVYEAARPLPAGVLWGMAYLIRPEGLVLIAVVAAWDLLRRRRQGALMLLGAAVCVLPYTVYLWRVTGHWLLSSKSIFLEQTLQEHPGGILALHYLHNVRDLCAGLAGTIGAPIAAAALLGAIIGGGRWLLPALPLIVLPVFSFRMDGRYWAPYLPIVLVAAASCFEQLGRWLSRPRLRQAAWIALAVVMLAGLVAVNASAMRQIGREYEYYPGIRSAGLWLRTRVPRETIVAARKPYVSFWAWCRYARTPDHVGASSIVSWARRAGAQYLEVNAWVAATVSPELLPLVDGIPEQLQDDLELVQTFKLADAPEQSTWLYRIKPAGERTPASAPLRKGAP
jgi:hypothetical protein